MNKYDFLCELNMAFGIANVSEHLFIRTFAYPVTLKDLAYFLESSAIKNEQV